MQKEEKIFQKVYDVYNGQVLFEGEFFNDKRKEKRKENDNITGKLKNNE